MGKGPNGQKVHLSEAIFEESKANDIDLNELETPIEFFQLFFDDDVFESINKQTDRYYQQKHGEKTRKRDSHHKLWSKPDLKTTKCYFGILLYMGIIQKPSLDHYWSSIIFFGSFIIRN